MSLEGLDCWDDYPMEHGCICGNDCEPLTPIRGRGMTEDEKKEGAE